MRTKNQVLFFLFALLFFFSCQQKDKLSNADINRFYENEEKLNHLIEALKKDTFLDDKWGELIERNKFNDIIKQKLNILDIDSVNLFSWGRKQRQFDFITSWKQAHQLHLYYNTLDSVQTVKGFYWKDEYSNEIWGLGNPWAIGIVRRYVERMQ